MNKSSSNGWTLLQSPSGLDYVLRRNIDGFTVVPIKVFFLAHPDAKAVWNKHQKLVERYGSSRDGLLQALKHFFPQVYNMYTPKVSCYRVEDVLTVIQNDWLSSLVAEQREPEQKNPKKREREIKQQQQVQVQAEEEEQVEIVQFTEDDLKNLWLKAVKKAYIDQNIAQWEAEVRAEVRQRLLAVLDE